MSTCVRFDKKLQPKLYIWCYGHECFNKLQIIWNNHFHPGVHFIEVKCQFGNFEHFFFGVLNIFGGFSNATFWHFKCKVGQYKGGIEYIKEKKPALNV